MYVVLFNPFWISEYQTSYNLLPLVPRQNDVCELKTKSVHSFTVIFPNDIYRSFDTVKEKKVMYIYRSLSWSTHVTLSVSPVRCKHWHINLYSEVNLNFCPCSPAHPRVCVCVFCARLIYDPYTCCPNQIKSRWAREKKKK